MHGFTDDCQDAWQTGGGASQPGDTTALAYLQSTFTTIDQVGYYTTGYAPTMPSALTQALAPLPIQHQDFTFIDIGCGKGRALLIAAQFPFRHLLGVEISTELVKARLRAGLSQAELAQRMGTSQSTIARLESGQTLPSTKTI